MSIRAAWSVGHDIRRGTCVALGCIVVSRFLAIVPAWYRGQPPAYEGQYLARLTSLLTVMPILLIAYLWSGHQEVPWTRWRAVLYGVLLAVASSAMALEWSRL